MTIRTERVISDVIPEPEASSSGGERKDQRWQSEERVRTVLAEQERLKLRIAAEGFDD